MTASTAPFPQPIATNRATGLAVLPDFIEERWPSMDLVARMLLEEGGRLGSSQIKPQALRPAYLRLSHINNVDRLVNRLWRFPQFVRRHLQSFDFFHVCDHSYSQLLHEIPSGRGGVYCHDLDTFRCLLDPIAEPRPRWFRAMARHILRGFEKAAVVFYATDAIRRQIEHHGLMDSARLVHAPFGVSREFSATPGEEESAAASRSPYLLHVGSCIPRKRIDVLLDVFAAVRRALPNLRLIQVGGEWTAAQYAQIDRLGLAGSIEQLRGINTAQLASLYRHASAVLQTSEAEGFGLPVIEALACGATVVASDIPVLREVGGNVALFRPVGEIAAWTDAVCAALNDKGVPSAEAKRAQAAKYSWSTHAQTILNAYLHLSTLGRAFPTR